MSLDLASILNPEQFRAASTTEGPLLILAGAGSGKTRVLVHRIAHILERGLAKPYQILAVTFTNKAAGEMRARLTELIGPQIEEAWIGTFHAMSARILRYEGHRLGYNASFSIYDVDDSRRLMKRIMEELGIDGASRGSNLSQVASEIDKAKNAGITARAFDNMRDDFETPAKRAARRVYPRYQAALMRSNAMDFGDLLMLAVQLLAHHPEAKRRFAGRFKYVMVDEFQDTNAVQYKLLKLLVSEHNNLAVVGDDDQAIYRWRGADVANILNFKQAFPSAVVVKLEENYRSSANILEAANTVIRKNTKRHPKTLRTSAEPGIPVRLAMVNRSEEEASLVAQLIAVKISEGAEPTDFAILYRQNAQSRLFEETLKRARVPYKLVGGTSFYDRMEVKDILAYLKVTANPASSQDFERIINTPTRGIGKKTIERLRAFGAKRGLEGALLLTATDQEFAAAGLKSALKKLRVVDKLLQEFRDLASFERATEIARRIIEKTRYLEHLQRTEPASAEDRAANVEELVSSIAEFEANYEARNTTQAQRSPLSAFLEEAALTTSTDESSGPGAISLMTMHAAKGLEFPVVFMVGMEEQTFPSTRAIDGEPEAMEEERRLCYVGMTRAESELVLTVARYRRIYGREEVRRPSRFLGELPDHVVDTLSMDPPRPRYQRAQRAAGPPAVSRGGDSIVYDGDPMPDMDFVPTDMELPQTAPSPSSSDSGGFRPGLRVRHNTFGVGTVESSDGNGPRARLTIHFPDYGLKKVVARFVEALD